MKIVLKGPPIAKNRHKCGCAGRRPFAYDPQIKQEMNAVRHEMMMQWQRAFESEDKAIVLNASNLAKATSFSVCYTFLFPVPKSDPVGRKNGKLWGFESYNQKPDLDNLEKFYSDCATGILWGDDAQIIASISRKAYDENPRTEMEIMVKEDLNVSPKAEAVLKIFGPVKFKEFLEDVKDFWSWPAERVDEVVAESEAPYKRAHLSSAASLLANFAHKHADALKKIQKCNGIDEKAYFDQKYMEAIQSGEDSIQ